MREWTAGSWPKGVAAAVPGAGVGGPLSLLLPLPLMTGTRGAQPPPAQAGPRGGTGRAGPLVQSLTFGQLREMVNFLLSQPALKHTNQQTLSSPRELPIMILKYEWIH